MWTRHINGLVVVGLILSLGADSVRGDWLSELMEQFTKVPCCRGVVCFKYQRCLQFVSYCACGAHTAVMLMAPPPNNGSDGMKMPASDVISPSLNDVMNTTSSDTTYDEKNEQTTGNTVKSSQGNSELYTKAVSSNRDASEVRNEKMAQPTVRSDDQNHDNAPYTRGSRIQMTQFRQTAESGVGHIVPPLYVIVVSVLLHYIT